MTDHPEILNRWRLILGHAGEASLDQGLTHSEKRIDAALAWLYGRAQDGSDQRERGPRHAGRGESQLTVPTWINEIHELFPQETVERLERDAIETYGIAEIVTNPDVLARIEPNETLLKAVLQTKHLMNEQVLASARQLVSRVVAQLMDSLAKEIRSRFSGLLRRDRSRRFLKGGTLDVGRTIRGNLAHYDRDSGKIYPQKTWFFERSRRQLDAW